MTSDESTLSQGWPDPGEYRRSIRFEISALVSGLILVLMLVTGYVITNRFVDTVTHDVVDKLVVQARSFSGAAGKHIITTSSPDALMLSNICKKLAGDNPDVYWAAIADNDNRFLAHTDIKKVVASQEMAAYASTGFADILRTGETFALVSDTIYISIPITENSVRLGRLGVASSMRQISEAREASVFTVATVTVIMLLLGLVVTTFGLQQRLKPIRTITSVLQQLSFDHLSIDIPLKTRNEFGYLSETLRVMGSKLSAAQRERLEKERMARDLEIAREIQARILPRAYPTLPEYTCAGVYHSALEVGGDYYDFIHIDAHRLAVLVADVSGKSLPGMLVMLLTRDIVKNQARSLHEPAAILSATNRELKENIKPGMFVTMFLGVLDKRTGRFSFASAGHNPLIHLAADGTEPRLIKTKGYPLGMMPATQFDKRIETGELTLRPGDWLVQYTDGVNEAHDGEEQEYGMNRFVQSVKEAANQAPDAFVQSVLARQQAFVGDTPQFDDITLVAVKWSGQSADTTRQAEKAVDCA